MPDQDEQPEQAEQAARVVVVGGAVLDTKLRTAAAPVLATSNPGTASWTETNTNRLVTGSNGIAMEHRISTSTGETFLS